jgi:hypothetical protein
MEKIHNFQVKVNFAVVREDQKTQSDDNGRPASSTAISSRRGRDNDRDDDQRIGKRYRESLSPARNRHERRAGVFAADNDDDDVMHLTIRNF